MRSKGVRVSQVVLVVGASHLPQVVRMHLHEVEAISSAPLHQLVQISWVRVESHWISQCTKSDWCWEALVQPRHSRVCQVDLRFVCGRVQGKELVLVEGQRWQHGERWGLWVSYREGTDLKILMSLRAAVKHVSEAPDFVLTFRALVSNTSQVLILPLLLTDDLAFVQLNF